MDTTAMMVNAMMIAIHRHGIRDALDIGTLMSATESFSIGIIARDDLDLEEYNLLIRCIAPIATPELILKEQTWTPDPLPKPESLVHQQYEELKQQHQKHRKAKDDSEKEDLASVGINPVAALKALLGKKKEVKVEPKVSREDAIAKMMLAMKKTPVLQEERVKIEKGSAGKYQLVGTTTGEVFGGEFERPADAIVYASRNKIKLGEL
jgi:hypothetical protein